MPYLSRRRWFPFLLFYLTLAAAAALFVLVILAPLLDNGERKPEGAARCVAVFARDAVLRKTAVASALCLAVTAYVFFRPTGRYRPRARKGPKSPKLPPPADIAGA